MSFMPILRVVADSSDAEVRASVLADQGNAAENNAQLYGVPQAGQSYGSGAYATPQSQRPQPPRY